MSSFFLHAIVAPQSQFLSLQTIQPFNKTAWLAHATFSDFPHYAFDDTPPSSPWPGTSRGAGYTPFTPLEILSCAARVGGVAFVGDSVMRETVNQLLRHIGGCCVDNSVGHAQQTYDRDYDYNHTIIHISFRFARNAAPELGDRVSELLKTGKVHAIVAGSGFWDLNPGQGGSSDIDFVTSYAIRIATFLKDLRSRVSAGTHTLVWNEVTNTEYSRIHDDRRSYLTNGRIAAVNAVARRLLAAWGDYGGGVGSGGVSGGGVMGNVPRWAIVDADLLIPINNLPALVSADGYHPTKEVLLNKVFAIFSELCPPFGPWSNAIDVLGAV